MKRRVVYSFLFVLLGLNLLVGAQIYFKSAQAAEKNNLYEQIHLFVRVLEKVRQEYVQGDQLTYEDLIHSALKGMLNSLDPHSEFMEPSKYDHLRSDTEGAFGGVGIVIGIRDEQLTVVAPMEDTPAFEAGILAGDKIVKIEGSNTERLTMQEAVKKLRGEPGTKVSITISRSTLDEPKDFTLTRAIIKVDTIKDIDDRRLFPLGDHNIGYIRILQFGEQTAPDLQQALRRLKDQGMQGLILDLRNNPGGLLDQAVKVCELFVPRGQVIVSTIGQDKRSRYEFRSKGRDLYPDLEIVVLVNAGSASASEIVAGCLQDRGRAFVMGDKTFGKGSVQSIAPLQNGSALRLTTAHYYTPSDRVIHEKGITPDSIISLTQEEEEALYAQRIPGLVESMDEEAREKVLSVTDIQLERANDFLKGMILYKDRAQAAKKLAGK
jgi:carboxyl-terminal processing protease